MAWRLPSAHHRHKQPGRKPAVSHALNLAPSKGETAESKFDNYTLVIGAALAGRGVAIGWRHLVDPLIEQGLLCRLHDGSLTSRYGYHLVSAQRTRRPGSAGRFVEWLYRELSPAGAALDSAHG